MLRFINPRFNHSVADFEHADLNDWVGSRLKTAVTLTNKFAFDITVRWNEESMDPVLHGIMKPGEETSVVRPSLVNCTKLNLRSAILVSTLAELVEEE